MFTAYISRLCTSDKKIQRIVTGFFADSDTDSLTIHEYMLSVRCQILQPYTNEVDFLGGYETTHCNIHSFKHVET